MQWQELWMQESPLWTHPLTHPQRVSQTQGSESPTQNWDLLGIWMYALWNLELHLEKDFLSQPPDSLWKQFLLWEYMDLGVW